MDRFDVVVIGAGAAGMMCAIEAGKRGRKVLVLDHAKAAGEKIRISGGGRCNFTNIHTVPDRFITDNPGFQISALRRYRPADFLALIEGAGIAWHEKTLGQLFCDDTAVAVVEMLKDMMKAAGVHMRLGVEVTELEKIDGGFQMRANGRLTACEAVVIATGGKSIPKMGSSGFAYETATKFGVNVIPTRPGLVPLTFEIGLLERMNPTVGVSVDARVTSGKTRFEEAMLFTHRGLSGPVVLQISSYWPQGGEITVDMAPGVDVFAALKTAKTETPRLPVAAVLSKHLPKRLAQLIADLNGVAAGNLADASDKKLRETADAVNAWKVKPVGSEGYRTAEVTVGGIDTRDLESRTMAVKAVPGLYFIGEAVDVTGWLGGYNFQWAWASGWCAGQAA